MHSLGRLGEELTDSRIQLLICRPRCRGRSRGRGRGRSDLRGLAIDGWDTGWRNRRDVVVRALPQACYCRSFTFLADLRREEDHPQMVGLEGACLLNES